MINSITNTNRSSEPSKLPTNAACQSIFSMRPGCKIYSMRLSSKPKLTNVSYSCRTPPIYSKLKRRTFTTVKTVSTSSISAALHQNAFLAAQAFEPHLCSIIRYGASLRRVVHGQPDGLSQDQLHAPLRGTRSLEERPQLHLSGFALPARLCWSYGSLQNGNYNSERNSVTA